MKKIGLVLAILVLLSCTPTYADMTIKGYKEQRVKNIALLKLYVAGVGEGFGWANSELNSKGQPLLFCQPLKLPITPDGFIAILDQFLEEPLAKAIPDNDQYVGLMLLMALQQTFPCPK